MSNVNIFLGILSVFIVEPILVRGEAPVCVDELGRDCYDINNFPNVPRVEFQADGTNVRFANEPLRNDYSPEERALIETLQSLKHGRKRGLVKNFKPRCYFENWIGSCCIQFDVALPKANSYNVKTCVETGLKLDQAEAYVGLFFNGVELSKRGITVGKLCWSLPPPFGKINTCLWVYHLSINLKQFKVEVCSLLEITPAVHIGFNCLRFEKGRFRVHDEIQPQQRGIVNVEFLGGKLTFKIESPGNDRIKCWFDRVLGKAAKEFQKKSAKFVQWLLKR